MCLKGLLGCATGLVLVKAGADVTALVWAYLVKEIKRSLKIWSLFQLIKQSVQGT